ncbi:MAG TPA: hypothetical protein VE757_05735 [Gaiellaceae bacterium]|nr:hypothetical protein [Gaiellaceae bacterium]
MGENDNEGQSGGNEGLSTGKKVVAGAALGVAVPAAVGVAKKLIGNGDDQEKSSGGAGRSQQGGGSTARSRGSSSSSRGRASGAKNRAGTTAKSGARRTRSGSTRSTSSSNRRSSSSSGGGSNRTKEQLYNQAKRLGIEGRSTMSKTQLERAIGRARSRS